MEESIISVILLQKQKEILMNKKMTCALSITNKLLKVHMPRMRRLVSYAFMDLRSIKLIDNEQGLVNLRRLPSSSIKASSSRIKEVHQRGS